MDTLQNRVAVITGGASGIGRELCRRFARAGARVVVADVDQAGMESTVAAVRQAGGEAIMVKTDVSRLGDVQALADRAFREWGSVHVLCNNAGVAVHGGLESATHRDWEWVIGVNLWGVIHGIESFVPRMIAQGDAGTHRQHRLHGRPHRLPGARDLQHHQVRRGRPVRDPAEGSPPAQHRRVRPLPDGRRHRHPRQRAQSPHAPAECRTPRTRRRRGHVDRPDADARARRRARADAILANRLYIITHEEGLEPLRRRFQRMERAIGESR